MVLPVLLLLLSPAKLRMFFRCQFGFRKKNVLDFGSIFIQNILDFCLEIFSQQTNQCFMALWASLINPFVHIEIQQTNSMIGKWRFHLDACTNINLSNEWVHAQHYYLNIYLDGDIDWQRSRFRILLFCHRNYIAFQLNVICTKGTSLKYMAPIWWWLPVPNRRRARIKSQC